MVHATDPIINSFAAFAKLCIDQKEIPYFKYDLEKLNQFFYDIKKEQPEKFKMVGFDINGPQPSSRIIDEAKIDMLTCGYLFSWGFNPYFVSKNAIKEFDKIEGREIYLDIAKKFYEKFACDERGNIGEHTKFRNLERLH